MTKRDERENCPHYQVEQTGPFRAGPGWYKVPRRCLSCGARWVEEGKADQHGNPVRE